MSSASELYPREQKLLVLRLMEEREYKSACTARRDVYLGKWDQHPYAQQILTKRKGK